MLSKKNSMVTMVTDEFLENRIILQKSVATIGFIWLFWFQKCILLYIFVQVFLVMRCIRSHISFFRLGLTPTLLIWSCVTDPVKTNSTTSQHNIIPVKLRVDLTLTGDTDSSDEAVQKVPHRTEAIGYVNNRVNNQWLSRNLLSIVVVSGELGLFMIRNLAFILYNGQHRRSSAYSCSIRDGC